VTFVGKKSVIVERRTPGGASLITVNKSKLFGIYLTGVMAKEEKA
jgi:hypothetical protein